ncbi:hypothetical protein D3C81_445360 [compost metagenome]
MLQHQDRNTDTGGDDRESGKGVTHHHGQQRHTDGINRHRDKAVIHRQILLSQMRDGGTDACGGKQQAQRGEDLRQNKRPTDGVQQAARFLNRLQRFLMGHFHRNDQPQQTTDGHREQSNQGCVVTAAEYRRLQCRNIVEQQHANHRHHRDGQCRNKQPVTQTFRALFALLWGTLMIATQTHAAKAGDQRHHHDHHADDNMQHAFIVAALPQHVAQQAIGPVANQEHDTVQRPEQTGGNTPRVGAIAERHHGDNQQHHAGQPIEILLLESHWASPLACSAA